MRFTFTRENNQDVIKIYLPDTTKKTEEKILKHIPSAINWIREQKKFERKHKKLLEAIREELKGDAVQSYKS